MTNTKRPNWDDDDVRHETAKRMLPAIAAWMGEEPNDHVQASLAAALRGDHDGYRLAKRLDDWDPDAELVSILDEAWHHHDVVLRDAVQRWVTENAVAIPFVAGDIVRPRHDAGPTGLWKHEGEVIDLRPEYAEVVVHCPALSHVCEGFGVRGISVAVEALERIGFRS